jgi:hypothetical protein
MNKTITRLGPMGSQGSFEGLQAGGGGGRGMQEPAR